ncbi:MAG: aminotransferase class IV [Gammaproteobacteria bacterium]
MSLVYLNGEFLERGQARVPVLDRGFVFGDGVYEVIPVYAGMPFRFAEHLRRLGRSLDAVGIGFDPPGPDWDEIVTTLIQANGGGDQSVYLQVTRGVAERDHVLAEAIAPTVLVMTKPLAPPAPLPVATITRDDFRWQRCDIKAIALLGNVLARREAAAAGAYEAIFLRDGLLTEGAASNVFVVSDGTVRTPPVSNHLLAGITRDLVLELLRGASIPVQEAAVTRASLEGAQEIWLTSSTREILPVSHLDGRQVGGGAPGPLWSRANALYQDCKRAFVARGQAVGTNRVPGP